MSAPAITPVQIRQSGERELTIRWSDGRESIYPVRDLRLACGCAHCIDEWSDGHASGIYPFERLRQLADASDA